MPPDHHYHRDERLILRIAAGVGLVVGVLAFFFAQSASGQSEPLSPEEVWAFIQVEAAKANLDPEFVYALAWAESSLNARAKSSVARGVIQLTKAAWTQVSDEPYRKAWNWRTNIRVGIAYLVFCREFLEARDSFSYPLLAASYRYGPYHVQAQNFNIRQLRQPRNEIYKRIFEGNIRPVVPPRVIAVVTK